VAQRTGLDGFHLPYLFLPSCLVVTPPRALFLFAVLPFGFVVGIVATVLAGLLARSTGQALYLSIAVLLGGVLSAIGARLAGKFAVSL
jgi:hypothetical protein